MKPRVVVAALLTASACSFPDLVHRQNDAASLDADPNTVHGTSVITYVRADGSVSTKPEDLSGYHIQAYVPNGEDVFTVVEGSGTVDGTFSIPNVPVGTTYYLSLTYPSTPNTPPPAPRLFVTDQRTLSIGFTMLGRDDVVEVHSASSLVLDISNLLPWTAQDYINVGSFNTGSEFTDTSVVTNAPSVGATSLTGFSFDWRNAGTTHQAGSLPGLIDASHGDDLYVTQIHDKLFATTKATYKLDQSVAYLKRTDLTQVDGAPLSVIGAMTAITMNKSVTITAQLAQFRAQYTDASRLAEQGFDIYAVASPVSQYLNLFGPQLWHVGGGQPYNTSYARGFPATLTLPPVAYGEPAEYASAWSRVTYMQYRSSRVYRVPGTTNTGMIRLAHETYVPSSATPNLVPAIRPVAMISVGDNTSTDEPGTVRFDGTKGLVVDWDDVTLADGYRVFITKFVADGTVGRGITIAFVDTTESRLVVPAQLLARGERYNFIVYTIKGRDETSLREYRLPGGFAGRSTNILLLSDACGDGVTDPTLGEECDTMGQSATCDADCSLVLCGDGYRNAAANEACDTGAASVSCNADCTPTTCGDAKFNAAIEDCDDGNTTETANGCSSTCTRLGTCGDSQIQTFFEQCDPPNGTTCGIDCRTM